MKRLLLAALAVAVPITARTADVPDIGGKELWRWLCESSGAEQLMEGGCA